MVFFNPKANAITISSNTTISASQTILNGITIENNAHVTIQSASTVLSVSGNIDVKPGSWLIIQDATIKMDGSIILESAVSFSGSSAQMQVENGTITALFSQWKGIEVWGNLGYSLQGTKSRLVLTDATIENAISGVATYHKTSGGSITNKGGIVQAINTVFKNNSSAVSIRENPQYYLNYINGSAISTPSSNPSYLYQCQFLLTSTNNPFYPITNSTQVRIYDAKVIKISGCTFDDQTASIHTTGIGLNNSGVEIGPYFPVGSQIPQPCIFKNLYEAISVGSPGTFTHVVAQQNEIEKSFIGINAYGTQDLILLSNHLFDAVPSGTQLGSGIIFGVGATGFTVEGNTIEDYYTGIYLSAISEENNEIYKNTISNYDFGVDYIGFGNGSGSEGLRLLCNDLRNTNKTGIFGMEIEGKMASYQGTYTPFSIMPWSSAGNLFTDLSKGDPQMWKISQVPSFTYFYSYANSAEYPGNTTFPLILTIPNSCPAHTPPIIIPNDSIYSRKITNLENQIFTLQNKPTLTANDSSALAGLLYQHQKLIDSMVYTIMYNNDTLNYTKLASVFEATGYGFYNKIRLAGVYLSELRYDSAINLLNNIPSNFTLNETQQEDISDMKNMYVVIDTLAHNGDNWANLPSSTKQQVHNVAEGSGMYGRGVAIYLLNRYEDYSYVPPMPVLPQNFAVAHNSVQVNNKIYPNPSTGDLFINWSSKKDLSMKIYSMEGNEVMNRKMHSGLNNINIRSLNSGVYFIQVFENKKSVYQQKIVKK